MFHPSFSYVLFNVPEEFVSARRPHLQPCCKYLQKPLNHHLTLLCRLCGNTASLQSASAEANLKSDDAISVTLLQGCCFTSFCQSAFPHKVFFSSKLSLLNQIHLKCLHKLVGSRGRNTEHHWSTHNQMN